MPPHGRRRVSSFTFFFWCFIVLASTASAAQAVIGIDVGTEYIKAALVKPGVPLDIVLTKDSKRKETAALAFKSIRGKVNTAVDESFPERIYGGDAVALSARFPGDVFPNLKTLLGLKAKDELATEYSSRRPELRLVELPDTGAIGFKSGSFVDEEEAFLVEELLAMELQNVKANAETMAGKGYTVQDAVITVPPFYTVEERKAISTAAELAGLRVLSLINDGLAVGLNYATSRTFPVVNEGGKSETHLVYDMGAGSTTATLLRFQGRVVKDVGRYNKTIYEVQVLGTGWDRTLGGDALNGIIVDDMVQKVIESPFIKKLEVSTKDITSHGRSMAKLWKEAERIRQVLSANTETQTTMEGFYNEDFTFKYKFKRSDFEALTKNFAMRVDGPIQDALNNAKLSMADVESVILHGGAVRTPFVQKILEASAGAEKIRTNVNSDEAAVFGAGFKAATIAPSFRVKEIRTSDTAIFPVFMSYTIDGKNKQQKLFVPTSQVGAEKQVSLKVTDDLSFELSQQVPNSEERLLVTSISTQNLTESVKQLTKAGCEPPDMKVQFGIRLSPLDGLPEVVGGSISCEVIESKKSGGVVDGVKDFLGFGSKKEVQQPLKDKDEVDELERTASSETSTLSAKSETASTTLSDSSTTTTTESSSAPAKETKKTESININFVTTASSTSGLKPDSLTRISTRLTAFDASDRARVLREEALNTLEGYTYKIRDILEDEGFINVSTAVQREEIEAKSNDASMWIYGDGADAGQAALKARLDELRGLVNPIIKRKEEISKRPDEIRKLQDALSSINSMAGMVKNSVEDAEKSASISSASAEAESSSAAAKASEDSSSGETTSATPPASSSTIDDFVDLEDDTTTATDSSDTASTTASAATSKTSDTLPPLPTYSREDLATLEDKETSIKAWLEEKLAAQEKLGPTDDPAMLSSELVAKTKEVNDAVMDIVMRQMPKYSSVGGSCSGSGSGSSGKKSKTKKASSKAKKQKDKDKDKEPPLEEMTIDVAKAASASASAAASSATDDTDSATDAGGWGAAPTDLKASMEEFEAAAKQAQQQNDETSGDTEVDKETEDGSKGKEGKAKGKAKAKGSKSKTSSSTKGKSGKVKAKKATAKSKGRGKDSKAKKAAVNKEGDEGSGHSEL